MSLGDVCQIAGGAVTLGFGVWHFAVPELYAWQSYVPDAPQNLVDAVAATNFFLSLSLSIVGASNIVMPLLADSATPVGRYWLWANAGLWTTRAVYQLVKPQGSFNPALQWGMSGAFVLTALLFIVAAVEASLREPVGLSLVGFPAGPPDSARTQIPAGEPGNSFKEETS